MKKWLSLLATLLMMLSFGASALAQWAVVNNPNPEDRLNLRAKPSTDAISYGKYYNGTQVEILSGPSNGWYRVRVGLGNGICEIEGYMKARYLAVGDAAASVRDARPTVALSQSDGKRIRLLDFHTGSCVGFADHGEKVTVLGVGTEYLHVVTAAGDIGMVKAELATPKIGFSGEEDDEIVHTGIAVVNNPNPADRLNLRAKPSSDAISYGKYYNGTQVEILSGPDHGWYRVRIVQTELEGYMAERYLATGEAAAKVKDMRPIVTVSDTKRDDVRLLGFYTGRCVGKVENDTAVTVLGIGTEYLHVMTPNGDNGLIDKELATPKIKYSENEK